MTGLVRAVRQAARSWSHQPLVALVAILTLALAIGANVSIFALVRGVLLRPPPYPEPDRLVFVWNSYPGLGLPESTVSIPDFLDRVQHVPEFSAATLFHVVHFNLTRAGLPERVRGLRITPSFFAVYGLPVTAGRAFTAADVEEDAEPVVVLTHEYFQRRFGGDPALLDRWIELHGIPHRVVGVTAPNFRPPFRDIQLYVPFSFTAAQCSDDERGNEFATMVARLAPGATVEDALASCRALIAANRERLPDTRTFLEQVGFDVTIRPYLDNVVAGVRPTLLLLQLGTLLLLAVAAVNLAHMVLARTLGRLRELAVRLALGASRTQIFRQLLTEGIVVTLPGLVLGLLLGTWGLTAIPRLGLDRLPRLREVELDLWVIGFSLLLSAVTALAFTLVPYLALPRRLTTALADAGVHTTASRRARGFRAMLVVSQVAFAMTLVTGSLLLLQSFHQLRKVDPGFAGDRILTATLTVPDRLHPTDADLVALQDRLRHSLAAVSGVRAVGIANLIPFGPGETTGTYLVEGSGPLAQQPTRNAQFRVVDEGYFAALDLPVRFGRTFRESDTLDMPPVCVVDQFFADRLQQDPDPTGRRIQLGGDEDRPVTIIGVIPTIRQSQLAEPVRRETIYFSARQYPPRSFHLLIRLDRAVSPDPVKQDLQEALYRVEPELPLSDFATLGERVDLSLGPRRAPAVLMTGFSLLALFLCGLGLYGTLAFAVGQRRREIGIRLALGASRRQVYRLVLGHGLKLAALGVILGCGLAAYLAATWQELLFETSALDPRTFTLSAALVLTVAAVATGWPARRATRIEPWIVMREE